MLSRAVHRARRVHRAVSELVDLMSEVNVAAHLPKAGKLFTFQNNYRGKILN